MRVLILLAGLVLLGDALAQERECPRDMTGIQTTANMTDSNGNPYEITSHSADARDPLHFLHAAINYMYFSNEGSDLRDEFVHFIRIRNSAILLPACNELGQCAEITVSSRAQQWGGFVGLAVHTGFDVTARFNGAVATDFIPVDSNVFWNRIPAPNDASSDCLRNDESSKAPIENGDDGSGDGDDPVDLDFGDEFPDIEVDYPVGHVEIIDPDEDGSYPELREL